MLRVNFSPLAKYVVTFPRRKLCPIIFRSKYFLLFLFIFLFFEIQFFATAVDISLSIESESSFKFSPLFSLSLSCCLLESSSAISVVSKSTSFSHTLSAFSQQNYTNRICPQTSPLYLSPIFLRNQTGTTEELAELLKELTKLCILRVLKSHKLVHLLV